MDTPPIEKSGGIARFIKLASLTSPYIMVLLVVLFLIGVCGIVIAGIYSSTCKRFLVDYFGFKYDELNEMKGLNGLKRILRGWDLFISPDRKSMFSLRKVLGGEDDQDSKDRDTKASTNFTRLWEVVFLVVVSCVFLVLSGISLVDISVHLIIRFVWVIIVSKFIYDTIFRKLSVDETENPSYQALVLETEEKEKALIEAMESLEPASSTRIQNLKNEYKTAELDKVEDIAAADDSDARSVVKDKYDIIFKEIEARIEAAEDSTNLYPVDDVRIETLKEELRRLENKKTAQFNKFASYEFSPWVINQFSTSLTRQNKNSIISALSGWIASFLGQLVFAMCLSKDTTPVTVAVTLMFIIWWVIAPVMDLQKGHTAGLFDPESKKSVLFNLVANYHPNSPMSTSDEVVVKLNGNLSSSLVSQAYALLFFVVLFLMHFLRSLFSPGYRIWSRLADNYSLSAILFVVFPVIFAWHESNTKLAEARNAGIKGYDDRQIAAAQGYNIGFLKGITMVLVLQAFFFNKKMGTKEITDKSTEATLMEKHNTKQQQKKAAVYKNSSWRSNLRR